MMKFLSNQFLFMVFASVEVHLWFNYCFLICFGDVYEDSGCYSWCCLDTHAHQGFQTNQVVRELLEAWSVKGLDWRGSLREWPEISCSLAHLI